MYLICVVGYQSGPRAHHRIWVGCCSVLHGSYTGTHIAVKMWTNHRKSFIMIA